MVANKVWTISSFVRIQISCRLIIIYLLSEITNFCLTFEFIGVGARVFPCTKWITVVIKRFLIHVFSRWYTYNIVFFSFLLYLMHLIKLPLGSFVGQMSPASAKCLSYILHYYWFYSWIELAGLTKEPIRKSKCHVILRQLETLVIYTAILWKLSNGKTSQWPTTQVYCQPPCTTSPPWTFRAMSPFQSRLGTSSSWPASCIPWFSSPESSPISLSSLSLEPQSASDPGWASCLPILAWPTFWSSSSACPQQPSTSSPKKFGTWASLCVSTFAL